MVDSEADSGHDSEGETALDAAATRLYAAPLAQFMSLRTELATQTKADGNTALAKRISVLRKPTASASLVNRLVLDDTGAVGRLTDLYDRLRRAHEDLDAGLLRELSSERRAIVGQLAAAALELDERREQPAALRDDVVATLDAAVADPNVAARLGRLTRPEHWSGFGVAIPTGTPELTLVRGGKDRVATKPASERSSTEHPAASTSKKHPLAAKPADSTAHNNASSVAARRLARATDKARAEFETAEAQLSTVVQTEQRAADQLKKVSTQMTELQRELEQTKHDLDKARREVKPARTRRREARSALDRAERR